MMKDNFYKLAIVLLIILLVCGTGLGATPVTAQPSDGTIAVSPADVSLEPGESQTIAVTYEKESDATPQGIEYTLTYDPDVVSVTNQEQGSYLNGAVLVNNISTAGKIEYTEAVLNGDGAETERGTVASFTIETAPNVANGATTPLEFTTAKASEGATEFTLTTTNGTLATASAQTDGSPEDDTDSDERTDDDDSESDERADDSSDGEDSADNDASGLDTDETTDDAESEETTDADTENENATNDTDDTAESNTTQPPGSPTETDPTTPSAQNETANETPTGDDTDSAVPGFGVPLAVAATVVVSYMIRRRAH